MSAQNPFWSLFWCFSREFLDDHFLWSNFRGGGANSDQGGGAMPHLPPPPVHIPAYYHGKSRAAPAHAKYPKIPSAMKNEFIKLPQKYKPISSSDGLGTDLTPWTMGVRSISQAGSPKEGFSGKILLYKLLSGSLLFNFFL